MPTYDYICSNCGKMTEVIHSINGSPPSACPACGVEGALTKAFNPPTIHFKGSGWAKKDRSGGRPQPTNSAESAESTDSTQSGPAKSTGPDGGNAPDSTKSGEGSRAPEAKPGAVAAKPDATASSPTAPGD
jgi:putative FmdB family regulatory protein